MEVGLVELLLRGAWIAWILPILVASLPCSKLGAFHGVILGFAGRGKIMQSSTNPRFTVPQRFFCHFYVLAVIWTTLLLFAMWNYAYKMSPVVSKTSFTFHHSSSSLSEHRYGIWISVFLLLQMDIQVIRRLFETIYIFKYSPSARLHILGYLTGFFFYTAAPLTLCCSYAPDAIKFGATELTEFIVKGKGALPFFEIDWWDFVNPLLKIGWCQWIGFAVFLWGWVHQKRCHAILLRELVYRENNLENLCLYQQLCLYRSLSRSEGSLREHKEKFEKYVIPHGDWFEIVSSPHYLAEIVIYGGLLLVSGGMDFTMWLLLAFVVANLTLAAAETHRWYHNKFDDYPKKPLCYHSIYLLRIYANAYINGDSDKVANLALATAETHK